MLLRPSMKNVGRVERHPSRGDRKYLASGPVGGLTAALSLRGIRGDRETLRGKMLVKGHLRGTQPFEMGCLSR
jgi:hypothetical protein